MKLDEALPDQKLSLDVTPLIDIAFILVLFFAVSTSFISGSDLSELKTNLLDLGQDKARLTDENAALARTRAELDAALSEQSRETEQLRRNILEASANADKLRWMIKTLEEQKLDLGGELEAARSAGQSLQSQLEQAYADYRALNLKLTGLQTNLNKQAETEKLLRALLLERAAERDALQGQLTAQRQQREQIQAKADEADQERLSLSGLLATRTSALKELEKTSTDQAAREKLLQQLLAERAAKLSDLEVRLVEANERERAQAAELESANQRDAASTAHRLSLQTENLKLRNELNRYQQLARLGEAQIERLLEAQQNLEAGLESDLSANRLGIERHNQRLVVQLSNRILFDSGSAAIKSEGVTVLRKVGEIIKSRTGVLDVQIGGHSDNVPVASSRDASSTGRSAMDSNWGLSSARAVNVVSFLETAVGIDPARLSAVGYGEHRPIADNDTPDGRSQNRRIEIVLVPR